MESQTSVKTKNITIGSKAAAMAIKRANPRVSVMPYCTGKYVWSGKAADYTGNIEVVPTDVMALWVERRQDASGPYAKIMCLVSKP